MQLQLLGWYVLKKPSLFQFPNGEQNEFDVRQRIYTRRSFEFIKYIKNLHTATSYTRVLMIQTRKKK
jgi:hypothetical protein